jgi:hypothetical protein
VGNQALPRKILKELKRIYDLVNRRAHASNSDFTKRKFFNVTIAIVALILLSGFMRARSNVGTLKLSVGVGVYSDNSFTNKITTIDWGTLDPGTTKSFSVYIRNEGSSALTLSMSASNWNPSTASNYLTLTWSYTGQTVNSNGYVQVIFTLAVSESITGISSFNFDINLVGTG